LAAIREADLKQREQKPDGVEQRMIAERLADHEKKARKREQDQECKQAQRLRDKAKVRLYTANLMDS
jgi:hypothetical protein